ncbi:MAG: hypothetical protein WAM85_00625, partial [Terracidiphilus sp.]
RYTANPDEVKQGPETEVPAPPKSKRSEYLVLLIGVGVLAVAAFFLFTPKRLKLPPPSDSDDLGAGVSDADGLKGHLVARWQGGVKYQLQIQPLDPRENSSFAFVMTRPPEPISINIRILDSSGFALCGKEIVLPFDPGNSATSAARPADLQIRQAMEEERERGKDIFQNQVGSDGQIAAINAQGSLPCSADQYKHFDYWDFSTNFPTIDEQGQLMNHAQYAGAQAVNEARKTARRKAVKKIQSAFYIEGDDRITGYEAASGALETSENRTFYIGRKSDQSAAAAWASSFAHIHYKCDQHANCALQRAGASTIIDGRMNE